MKSFHKTAAGLILGISTILISGCPQPECEDDNFWPCTEQSGLVGGASPSQVNPSTTTTAGP